MRRLKSLVVLTIVAVTVLGGWRVGSVELANLELQQDLHDLTSQSSFRFGNTTRTDDDVRDAVIRKAMARGIELQPNQVTIQHPDDRPNAPLYLAADYSVPVDVADYSFVLHFQPSSDKTTF